MEALAQAPHRLIFVGGKGGVGKTTCSSSLAVFLAKQSPAGSAPVLLVSTDPAHNLCDAFGQEFTGEPSPVTGVDGLFALEINPEGVMEKEVVEHGEGLDEQILGDLREWLKSVPGIDEAMALSVVLQHVESGEYSRIVFDTAPTGHTLRLLKLPDVLQSGIDKLTSWKAKLSSVIDTVSMMFSGGAQPGAKTAIQKLEDKLKFYHAAMTKISSLFKDPQHTTFVCVCIAELLSVEETKRLVAELRQQQIATSYILVNQLVPQPPDDSGGSDDPNHWAVAFCNARRDIQQKYVAKLQESLEEDMAILGLPLLTKEVHGVDALVEFNTHLRDPILFLPKGKETKKKRKRN